MDKGELAVDPRGLIFEAYRIEGITAPDCRTVFLDWALGAEADLRGAIETLLAEYAPRHPDHPMTAVLQDGLTEAAGPRRRGGARGRDRG